MESDVRYSFITVMVAGEERENSQGRDTLFKDMSPHPVTNFLQLDFFLKLLSPPNRAIKL